MTLMYFSWLMLTYRLIFYLIIWTCDDVFICTDTDWDEWECPDVPGLVESIGKTLGSCAGEMSILYTVT
jgi:hypothetical protein